MLLREKDLALRHELRAILPRGYYVTSDYTFERFDPAVQPFGQQPSEPTGQEENRNSDEKSKEENTTMRYKNWKEKLTANKTS